MIVLGAVVAVLACRSFLSVYALMVLVPLGAVAAVRAVVRLVRGIDTRDATELRESARSLLRALAWTVLCGVLLWGHARLSLDKRRDVERFAMTVEDQKDADGFPVTTLGVPLGCSYGRPAPTRFFVVCTLTPPFEKATYTSSTKRWE